MNMAADLPVTPFGASGNVFQELETTQRHVRVALLYRKALMLGTGHAVPCTWSPCRVRHCVDDISLSRQGYRVP
jgi:hypothetical protein